MQAIMELCFSPISGERVAPVVGDVISARLIFCAEAMFIDFDLFESKLPGLPVFTLIDPPR
jgi:hypothetical protein